MKWKAFEADGFSALADRIVRLKKETDAAPHSAPFFMTFAASDWTVSDGRATIVIDRSANHLIRIDNCVNARFFSESGAAYAQKSYMEVSDAFVTLVCVGGSGYDGAVLIGG